MRGGCLELLVGAIAHATGPESPPQAEACSILGSAVATLRQITKLEGSGCATIVSPEMCAPEHLARIRRQPIRIFLEFRVHRVGPRRDERSILCFHPHSFGEKWSLPPLNIVPDNDAPAFRTQQRRVLVDAGGLPQLLRLSRHEQDNIRRDASQALKNIGHKGRDR